MEGSNGYVLSKECATTAAAADQSAAVGSPGGPQAPSARRLTASTGEAAGRATEGGGLDSIRKRGYPVRGPGAEREFPAAPGAVTGCDARLVAAARFTRDASPREPPPGETSTIGSSRTPRLA